MLNSPTQKPKSLRARVLSGSFVLLSGSGLATAINFAYNIAVARFLGPNGFGHATAVYTLLTLISAVTLSFQIISAKIVAQQKSMEGKSAGYRGFHAVAWVCSIFFAILLLIFQQANHRLSESAQPCPDCSARDWGTFLHSAGEPARLSPGHIWLSHALPPALCSRERFGWVVRF